MYLQKKTNYKKSCLGLTKLPTLTTIESKKRIVQYKLNIKNFIDI